VSELRNRDTSVHELIAIAEVVLIDITLAADNAVIVGLAASRVTPALRSKAIFWGLAGATALRLSFAVFVTQIVTIIGLTLAGGLLLLWVCWKTFRELRADGARHSAMPAGSTGLWRAVMRMVVADVSMSLDNVLAIAGAARDSWVVLAVGVVVSVTLMAMAANFVATLLTRFPWIAWIGLLIVVYVALDMIWRGFFQIEPHLFG
jgi:YjbE family integral membrane protein